MAYRRSRRRRRGTRWTILPAIALTLFVPVLLLSRTGLDKKFEALIARGASDERLGPALLTFALGGLSQPGEPETPD